MDPLLDADPSIIQLMDSEVMRWSDSEYLDSKQQFGAKIPYLFSLNDRLGFKMTSVKWNYVIDEVEFSGGEFCLYNPAWSYSNFSLPDYLMDHCPFPKEELVVIDEHPFSGDGFKVITGIGEESINDLFLVDTDQNFFSLDLNFETYLDFSLRTRGFYFWPYLFAQDISELDKQSLQSLGAFQRMREHLPLLFNQVDFSSLFQKLDEF